jgi:hypothetical protein
MRHDTWGIFEARPEGAGLLLETRSPSVLYHDVVDQNIVNRQIQGTSERRGIWKAKQSLYPCTGNQDTLADYCRGRKHCINHVGASSHSATKWTKASLTDGKEKLLMNHQQRWGTELVVIVGERKGWKSEKQVLVYVRLLIMVGLWQTLPKVIRRAVCLMSPQNEEARSLRQGKEK